MKSIISGTLPYRKCVKIYQNLIKSQLEEIGRNTLRRLISKHCGASPKTLDLYEDRFLEFGFLKRHPEKTNIYLVNQKNILFPEQEQNLFPYPTKESKNSLFQNNLDKTKSNNSYSNANQGVIIQQSKTGVYPVGGERKVTLSFKGYRSVWDEFKEAVWSDGVPDICYVEHIFHAAYLGAKRSESGRIDVPFKIRDMNFYVTINAPYIVQRARRKIRVMKKEIIEEDY